MSGPDAIEIEVDGRTYRGSGIFRKLGPVRMRRSVPGGYIETITGDHGIAGTVVFDKPVRGDMVRELADATVRVTRRGSVYAALTSAWMKDASDGRVQLNEFHICLYGNPAA